LLVEAVTVEGEMLRFDVALTDVQHLVAFLLVSDSCHPRSTSVNRSEMKDISEFPSASALVHTSPRW